jgi:hypothetical protein
LGITGDYCVLDTGIANVTAYHTNGVLGMTSMQQYQAFWRDVNTVVPISDNQRLLLRASVFKPEQQTQVCCAAAVTAAPSRGVVTLAQSHPPMLWLCPPQSLVQS